MFDTKKIQVVAKPIKVCNSCYFIIPKKVYRCKPNKYYKLDIEITEVN